MRIVASIFAGGLFGLGLVLSDMINASRVQGFFDVLGNWDPTLVFVIIGANLPMMAAWYLTRSRSEPVLGGRLPAPATTRLDRDLLGGAVLFGAGWGLVGLCPGTVLASSAAVDPKALVFLVALLAGLWLRGHAIRRDHRGGPLTDDHAVEERERASVTAGT